MIRVSSREAYLHQGKERVTLSPEELELKHLASSYPTLLIHSMPTEEKVTLANLSHNTRKQPCDEYTHADLTEPWTANLDDGIMQAAYVRARQVAK